MCLKITSPPPKCICHICVIFWRLFRSQICDIFHQFVTYVGSLQLTTFVTSFNVIVKILLWEFTTKCQSVASFSICDICVFFCQFVTYVGSISHICDICGNFFLSLADLLYARVSRNAKHIYHICDICYIFVTSFHWDLNLPHLSHMW